MKIIIVSIAYILFAVSSIVFDDGAEIPINNHVAFQKSALESTSEKFVDIKRVFPRLRFDRPVFLTGAGDNSGRLFVIEQAGVVRVFSKREHSRSTELDSNSAESSIPASNVFLDLRDRISRKGNEEGLIGFAFHPNYKQNGIFFVHYSSSLNDMHGIVSRFRVSADDPEKANPDSEEILLQVKQPYRNHNGGSIDFGPDGYLYITLGDGGNANDPLGNGQNLESVLGAILRIDVDNKDDGLAYAIPKDNPFVGIEKAKPELWAIGLRNVWRMSFDRKLGDLWAADVGQNKWEEVDIIRRGGNYGWNRYEANADFRKETKLAIGEHDKPVAAYGRNWGISVTGGYVYRGRKFPELDGSYFYGDYATGNLWRVTKNKDGKFANVLVRRTGRSISSFGEDDEGELYLLSFDGGVYQIVTTDEPENTFADWPVKLSETGLYESTAKRKISPNLIPYEINAPFWSDHASKSRFLQLPKGKNIAYRSDGPWEVPVGTTLVKNFEGQHGRGQRMLETRLIKRTIEGWESATYVWNADGKDATLFPGGQQFELYQQPAGARVMQINSWHAPSASECASCHTDAAGYVLGLRTSQLNRELESGQNQITSWADRGLIKLPEDFDPKNAARFCDPYDKTSEVESSLDSRARVWLDVNCAMCHRPDGPGNASIDLRISVALEKTKMVNELPAQGDMGIVDAKILSPGNPETSLLLHRVETLGQGRMPNLGSNQIDGEGAALLREWITKLKD